MRRLQARGIFAALENEELNVPPVEEAPAELPNHAESLEADLADMNAEHADISEHDAQIDEAQETVEALEAIREQLIEADKEGGLTRSGAAILKISLEHMYGRLGLGTDKVVPAMESFGGAASRQESTQIALEEMNETIARVWQAIIDAAKQAWEWIKKWYMKLFDGNTKAASRAEALKAAAAKMADGEPKSKEIQNDGLFKKLELSQSSGISNLAEGIARVEAFAGEFASGAGHYFANLTKLIDSVREGHPVDLKPEELSLGLKHREGSEASKLGLKVAAGATIFASDELPGGKFFVSAYSGNAETSFVGMTEHSVEAGEAKSLPTLDKGAIEKIAEGVKVVTDKVASTKSDLDAAGKALESLIAAGQAQMKAQGKEQDEQSQASVKLARLSQKLITGAATEANKYLVDVCEAFLAWGELSIRAHSGTALGNAAEKVGEHASNAADAVKDAAGKAGAAVKDAAGKAGAAVKGAVNSAASKVADKTAQKPA